MWGVRKVAAGLHVVPAPWAEEATGPTRILSCSTLTKLVIHTPSSVKALQYSLGLTYGARDITPGNTTKHHYNS